jgi:Holliday junction resolvase RusA-like endonuclease
MTYLLDIFVPGIPRPGGSKRAFTFHKKDGGTGVRVADMGGKNVMRWRSLISDLAHKAVAEPTNAPICITVIFHMPRPKYHFRKNGTLIEKQALDPHDKRPDLTKLIRALEDSLTGIVWRDDAQIIEQHLYKSYDCNTGAGAHVRIVEVNPKDEPPC